MRIWFLLFLYCCRRRFTPVPKCNALKFFLLIYSYTFKYFALPTTATGREASLELCNFISTVCKEVLKWVGLIVPN
jgi:hypothetical protein